MGKRIPSHPRLSGRSPKLRGPQRTSGRQLVRNWNFDSAGKFVSHIRFVHNLRVYCLGPCNFDSVSVTHQHRKADTRIEPVYHRCFSERYRSHARCMHSRHLITLDTLHCGLLDFVWLSERLIDFATSPALVISVPELDFYLFLVPFHSMIHSSILSYAEIQLVPNRRRYWSFSSIIFPLNRLLIELSVIFAAISISLFLHWPFCIQQPHRIDHMLAIRLACACAFAYVKCVA